MATYYSTLESKQRMANGAYLDDSAKTCACWWLPLGYYIKVTNLYNNKSVIVKVTDRGPALNLYCVEYTNAPVIIDLSVAAFQQIADLKQGKINVTAEVIK